MILRLTDGRILTVQVSETPVEFAARLKEALKDSGIIVVGDEERREYVVAAQVVSFE